MSCQSALAYYGLIPEYAPTVFSVCSDRPGQWDTPLGSYRFRHIGGSYLFGYELLELEDGQRALVGESEKAMLDLIYLTPGADSEAYLRTLRLQDSEQLDEGKLAAFAERFEKPKLRRTGGRHAHSVSQYFCLLH